MQPVLTTIFLALAVDVCWGMSACSSDKDCPKEHMVCRLNVSFPTPGSPLGPSSGPGLGPGVCGCKDDWVAWKWECHPPVTLGEACLTTVQCQTNNSSKVVCNPITRKCDCEPGYVKQLRQERTITCSTNNTAMTDKATNDSIIAIFKPDKALARPKRPPGLESRQHSKGRTYSAIEKAVNLAVERHRGEQAPEHQARAMDPTIFIALSLVLVGFAGIVMIIYMKTVHEKKTSQAAVRSLLNMMAEQDQLQRSYSLNSGYNTNNGYNNSSANNANSSGYSSNSSNSSSYTSNNSIKQSDTSDSLKTNVTDLESVTEARQNNPPQYTDIARPRPRPCAPIFDHQNSLPSKITLVPLEGENVLKLPSPHLSNPKLPPIKGAKLDKQQTIHQFNLKYLHNIHQNNNGSAGEPRLESQQSHQPFPLSVATFPLSVATFPEEDPPSYTDLLR